jgi:hypothetical protein
MDCCAETQSRKGRKRNWNGLVLAKFTLQLHCNSSKSFIFGRICQGNVWQSNGGKNLQFYSSDKHSSGISGLSVLHLRFGCGSAAPGPCVEIGLLTCACDPTAAGANRPGKLLRACFKSSNGRVASLKKCPPRLTGNTETFLGVRLRKALRRDKQTGNWKQTCFASPCKSTM